jgi:hypothetical protein
MQHCYRIWTTDPNGLMHSCTEVTTSLVNQVPCLSTGCTAARQVSARNTALLTSQAVTAASSSVCVWVCVGVGVFAGALW